MFFFDKKVGVSAVFSEFTDVLGVRFLPNWLFGYFIKTLLERIYVKKQLISKIT